MIKVFDTDKTKIIISEMLKVIEYLARNNCIKDFDVHNYINRWYK